MSMQRKYSCNEPIRLQQEISLARRSTIGYQTEQLNRIDYVIGELVLQTNFKMAAFVAACNQYPQIKDQTKLIHEIFLKQHFVQDLVAFLMAPGKMVAKFSLSAEEARGYVSTIATFLKENYDFYEFYFLGLERGVLRVDAWFEFLNDPHSPSFHTSLGYLTDVFGPFIKYEFSTSSRITEYFEKHCAERSVLLMDHFSQEVQERLLRGTQHEAVFKVVLNLVLVSLQEQEWKKSLALLKALCLSGIGKGGTLDSHVDNLVTMVRQVANNIDKDVNNKIFAFIDTFVQTDIVTASLARITDLLQCSDSLRKGACFSFEEECALEGNFKLLAEIINLYSQLRGIGIGHTAAQMLRLRQSIVKVYQSISGILMLLKSAASQSLNFSSGEMIRSVGMYRSELLNLLRVSLVMIKQQRECVELRQHLEKSQILQFLTRCLGQNRWNSIVHCLIEKIVGLMINTEFFKSRSSSSFRRFLSFLVQAFSNKKFMFLNSAKMINQGDIHSLYCLARKVTLELDRMPAIVDSTNEFDFWKDFVLKVLQKYEHFSERRSSQVEWEEDRGKEEDGGFRVQIDEVALIKEIVKKIEVNKKWNFKKDSQTFIPRIGSASELKKKRNSQKGDSTPGLPSRFRVSANQDAMRPLESTSKPSTISRAMEEMSVQEEEIEMSGSGQSSEEVGVAPVSSHSDTDQLEEDSRSQDKKMTQSGW